MQYACDSFVALLNPFEAIQSRSGRGNCYDNAVAESIFPYLKTERVFHERYHTREEARRSLFEYMEGCYNRTRRDSTLGYRSLSSMNPEASGQGNMTARSVHFMVARLYCIINEGGLKRGAG
ncbi:MAG: transposase [Candidatus Marinimicrobia bacterium]|nr:transposase [Candidatus Neomarinimicrobiota bacterium]